MDILTPQTDTPFSGSSTGTSIVGADGHLMPLEGYFSIQNPSGPDLDALNYIFKYYETKVRSVPEMLLAIRQVEQQLGMAALGENRLQQIYKYIKIDSQIADLHTLKQSMQHVQRE